VVVSRTRFLLLTAAMAGCSSGTEETPGGHADAGAVADSGAAVTLPDGGCQDDDGFVPTCDAVNGLAERQCDRATCEQYVKRMKTRTARLAIQCMNRHIAAGDTCRPCSGEALANSCREGVALTLCTTVNKTCPVRAVSDCVPLVSGLSFGGQVDFVSCVTESNCFHDMPSCLP
jgi:hypothetical protein